MAATADGRAILAVNIVLPVLAIIAVALRLLARREQKVSLKLDDYFIITALVITIGVCIGGIYAAATGVIGVSIAEMTQSRYEGFEKLLFVDVLLCHLIYGLIKVSVLLFFRRIFVRKWFKLCTTVMMGIVVAWMIAAFAANLAASNPVSRFWDHSILDEANSNVYFYPAFLVAMCALDLVLDLTILSLPLPAIHSLHMTSRRKWQVSGIFLLGFFCVVSSAVRMYYVYLNTFRFDGTIDQRTYDSDMTDVWGHVEACASVITACLPTLAPLFREQWGLISLLRSVRSLFTLRSRSQTDNHSDMDDSMALTEVKGAWRKMNAQNITTNALRYDGALEEQSAVPGQIVVNRHFGVDSHE